MLTLFLSLVLSATQFQTVTHVTDNMVESIDVDGYKHRVNREDIRTSIEQLEVGDTVLAVYVPMPEGDDMYIGTWGPK